MGGTLPRLWEKGGAYGVLVWKPEGKRQLGRHRRRWEDNIRMNLHDVAWGMNWFFLAQEWDRWRAVVNVVMNLWVP